MPVFQKKKTAHTWRSLLYSAALAGWESLPNCGSITVTVGINVDSCPSGCNHCGSRFDNITCKTLTYTMLTSGLAAETLHTSLRVRTLPSLLSQDLDFISFLLTGLIVAFVIVRLAKKKRSILMEMRAFGTHLMHFLSIF